MITTQAVDGVGREPHSLGRGWGDRMCSRR